MLVLLLRCILVRKILNYNTEGHLIRQLLLQKWLESTEIFNILCLFGFSCDQ